ACIAVRHHCITKALAQTRSTAVVKRATGTWHLAEPTRLRRGMTFAAVFTSVIIMLFVSVLKDYRSWVWQYALTMVVAFDGFALGLTAYLTSRHWGWTGLWLYLI